MSKQVSVDHDHSAPIQGLEKSTNNNSCLKIDTVNKCLTDDCNDCTGSYRNDLLEQKIICHCQCHNKKLRALESVEGSISNALDVDWSSGE